MPALEPPQVTGMAYYNQDLNYLANKFCEINPRLSNRLITD